MSKYTLRVTSGGKEPLVFPVNAHDDIEATYEAMKMIIVRAARWPNSHWALGRIELCYAGQPFRVMEEKTNRK